MYNNIIYTKKIIEDIDIKYININLGLNFKSELVSDVLKVCQNIDKKLIDLSFIWISESFVKSFSLG